MKALHHNLSVTLARYEAQMSASVTVHRVIRYRRRINWFRRLPATLQWLLGGSVMRLLLTLALLDAEANYMNEVLDDFMSQDYGQSGS